MCKEKSSITSSPEQRKHQLLLHKGALIQPWQLYLAAHRTQTDSVYMEFHVQHGLGAQFHMDCELENIEFLLNYEAYPG